MSATEELPEDEDIRDEEYPDAEESGSEATVPCPTCGRWIHEDAVKCPSCGNYVTPGAGPAARAWPWWMWLGVALAAAVLLGWIARR